MKIRMHTNHGESACGAFRRRFFAGIKEYAHRKMLARMAGGVLY